VEDDSTLGATAEANKRTAFAQQGLDFVTLFAAKFVKYDVGGYRPVLREPLSDSTHSGAQAVQHMVLEPRIAGDPLVTVGQVNVATKQAKVRTYECLVMLHQMRFGRRAFHVDAAQYRTFFEKLLEFMRRQVLQVHVETRPPEVRGSTPPGEQAPAGNVLIWVMLAAVLVFSAVAAYLAYSGRLTL
jgi:hypothetical protein